MSLKYKLHRIKYFFKRIYQRIRYSFTFEECWNIDYSIARYVLPRLKYYRAHMNGHPYDSKYEDWEKILDEIIWFMQDMIDDKEEEKIYDKYFEPFDNNKNMIEQVCITDENRKKFADKVDKLNERKQKAAELFGKYFMSLWD